MLAAVLFDWGETLVHLDWSEQVALEGTRAGLAALARDGLPDPAAVNAWFDEHLAGLSADDDEEVVLADLLASCFAELGCSLDDDDVRLYAQASHDAWAADYAVSSTTHALLDALHDRGLKLGLVSNTAQPEWLLRPVFEQQGLAERLDAIVLSSEVGKRKPHPSIFERALSELVVVDPANVLFVGDRLREDVGGAAALGMKTAQALWFRADDGAGPEPDFRAFTQMDVLNAVRRLQRET